MGKSSKKRKRGAEIAAAAASSVVVSEQAEEGSSSAMDMEAANYVYSLGKMKPEDNKILVLKGLDDSISMYERLESQGKELPKNVPENILSRLMLCRKVQERGTDGGDDAYSPILLHPYMRYYFDPLTLEDSPYVQLRINRFEEDGQLVLPGYEDEDVTNFGYEWGTKKSHQYAILWDELLFLLEKRWDRNRKLDYANSIAATRKLDLLDGYDVKDCLEEVLGSQHDKCVVQRLEYHRYLFNNEAKNITDEEKLWEDVKEKFPLLNQYWFRCITDLFYPSGERCEQKKLKEIMRRVERCYELAMAMADPLPAGKYYKLKQQLALKFGFVKYDSEGFLVDNYSSSEWEIP